MADKQDAASVETEDMTVPENAMDITENKDGGIMKSILRDGEGYSKPSSGDTVFVHYVGALTNGEKFDSSRDRGERFEFQLGKGKVIKAWDKGVGTMLKGELARFWCKPDYAYGVAGSPPKIPPNSTLVFEIELFDWKGEDITSDKDGGIMKHEIKKGDGYKTPNDGAIVNVHYAGRYNGKVFEERDIDFEVGDADEKGLIPALNIIATNLKKGEKGQFDVAPKYGYGQTGHAEFNIPAGATLDYEVEMKNFEKVKEAWEMDTKEKLEQSDLAKSKGTAFFKAEKYSKAVQNYKLVGTYLENETSLEKDEQVKRDALVLAAHLNLAMCYLKMNEHFLGVEQCDQALEMDKNNVKAFFRRGQACVQTCDFESAKADFEKILTLEPENKAAKNQITLCGQKIKQFKDGQKKLYAGMFTKFAEQDAKNAPKIEISEDEPMDTEAKGDAQHNGEEKPEITTSTEVPLES